MKSNCFRSKGIFHVTCFDKNGKFKWEEIFSNITTDQGLTALLDIMFSSGTQILTWYIGLKGSAENPAAGWNAAGIGTQFTEFVAYTEAARQTWIEAGVSSKSITNSASSTTFSINSAGTVYGAFLISENTKAGTTGTLYSISDFGTNRPVINGDVIKVNYTITAADA